MTDLIPLLELHNLSCERDERCLFTGLNLTFAAGDLVQIGGPNGAGKTTLLRALAGISQDYQGEIHYKGQPLSTAGWDFARDSLYLGHLAGIKKALSPSENLSWYLAQTGEDADINQALAVVGLYGYEDTPCYQLSAGQLRRVALARLYLSQARIWILDEPFTAIDKKGVSQLEAIIAKQVAQGGVVILTSHQDLTLPQLRIVNLQDYQPVESVTELSEPLNVNAISSDTSSSGVITSDRLKSLSNASNMVTSNTDSDRPQLSLFAGFVAGFRRDFLVAARHKSELANPLVFFLIAITLIPLGVSPEASVLALLAPGIVWVMALLATLLSLDGLFRSDYDDGSLEQMLISPQSLYFSVMAKVLVHWLVSGLPVTLLAPILGLMLSLPLDGYGALFASLLLGTAAMSLIGAVGAALTVSLRKGGLLLSLIVMPLYIPILIFGASSVQTAVQGGVIGMQLAVLGAFLALAIVLAPIAALGALRISANG